MDRSRSDGFLSDKKDDEVHVENESLDGSSAKYELQDLLDQMLDDPLKYASDNLLSGFTKQSDTDEEKKDGTEPKAKSSNDNGGHDHHHNMSKKNSFCSPIMMIDEHSRRLQGLATMPLRRDMSQGMVMYMDGFRFAMAGNQPCLNLYFPSWTLDTRTKFVGCLLLVFLLSFGTEGVSKYRHKLSSKRPTGRQYHRNWQIKISALHGLQAFLGYIVMLATMTFSVEILVSVVVGLSTGYYYFFAGELGLEGHVTTNPCCNYMQGESDEHGQAPFQPNQHQQQATPLGDSMTVGLLNTTQEGTNNNV